MRSCSRAFCGSLVLCEKRAGTPEPVGVGGCSGSGLVWTVTYPSLAPALVTWLLSAPRLSIRLCLHSSAHEASPPTAPL